MKITKLVFLSVITLCVANVPFVFAQIETPTNAQKPIQGIRVEFQNDIQNIREGVQEGVKEMRDRAKESTKEVREQVRENIKDVRKETQQKAEEVRSAIRQEVRDIKEGAIEIKGEWKEEFMKVRENAFEEAKKIQEMGRIEVKALREDQVKVVMEKREELKKQIETQREEFKKQIEEKSEELKKQIETKKVEFEVRVARLKDEKKKEVMTRIGQNLNEANKRALENFSNAVERLEKVLLNINSRADKASAAGKDVSGIKAAIGEANTAIVAARTAIQEQMGKVYEITINTEETLKNDASIARDVLKNDLEKVKNAVQKVKEVLQKAVVSLTQIPQVNVFEGNTQTSSSEDQVESMGDVVGAEGTFSNVTSPLVINLILMKTGNFAGSSFVLTSKDEKIQKGILTLKDGVRIKITGTVFRNNKKISYPEAGEIKTSKGFDFVDVIELVTVSSVSQDESIIQ